MSAPPAIPPGQPYTPYWCEENIYLLAHAFQGAQDVVDAWDVFVVFISNESKTVALWNQRAASAEGRPIVWDYHVILVLRPRSNPAAVSASSADTDRRISWIYDFDTTLTPVPLPAEDYILNTFSEVPLQFQALLKVVPGPIFLDEFSSDRSHMVRPCRDVWLLYC
ncbi:hypothetical protein PLICRDRAFT_592736 [Plicaturopsis crispa FD-325 SS-3]|nr:hypothetical protein PLICRDRAFT_592736 [Plicaturopsis crispa FD-325 SS-3]